MKNNIKQKTIGVSPLESYLLYDQTEEKNNQVETEQTNIKKQRITIHISAEIINKVKNAVYWEPGLTLACFAEMALTKALDELEKEKGSAYPERKNHQLNAGRPIK